MKKTLALLLIFIILAVGIYFFKFRESPEHLTVKKIISSTDTKDIQAVKIAEKPITISIPSINVDADIEEVGLDPQRNMDVPKKAENTGWYRLGPRPGDIGSAVIAGHLDDPNGDPAVFWDLKKLKPGEEIIITDKKGDRHKFIVKKVENYPWDDFPLNEVFADKSGKKLNLITCGGEWNKEERNYSQRTVIYSEIVE